MISVGTRWYKSVTYEDEWYGCGDAKRFLVLGVSDYLGLDGISVIPEDYPRLPLPDFSRYYMTLSWRRLDITTSYHPI